MIESEIDCFVWSLKYRPRKIEDCVLPKGIKDILQSYVDAGRLPNLLFSGIAGIGKTTAAKALCDQIGADYITINGSLDMNLEMIRTTVQQFASTVSLAEGQKVIILDEADGLSHHVQPALRSFIDEFSASCSFILTANFKHRLIDPLVSRCIQIDFGFNPSEKPKLAAQFFKRTCAILEKENIEFEKTVVAELVTQLFPDFRQTLNQLQMYSASGTIDTGILSIVGDFKFKELIKLLKEKKFTDVRKWVVENGSMDQTRLFRELFDRSFEIVEKQSVPELILLLAKYQHQHAFVADKELNLMALLTEVMLNLEFS